MMTSTPNEKLDFLGGKKLPNPEPRLIRITISLFVN
jgi:hypothetical protein